jgi:hypothetical protein
MPGPFNQTTIFYLLAFYFSDLLGFLSGRELLFFLDVSHVTPAEPRPVIYILFFP